MARLVRDFILIIFGFFVTLALPALAETWSQDSSIQLPIKLWILGAVIIVAIPYLGLLYWLGKIEEDKQTKRDNKLINEILTGLGYGTKGKSEHFDSIL